MSLHKSEDRETPPIKQRYDVVQGLILNNTRDLVLMACRLPTGKLPSLWEYPGGKVEPGEMCPDAIKRELKEELGIDVIVEGRIAVSIFSWQHEIGFHLMYVASWTGEPKPLASSELRWVDPKIAIDTMPLHPAAYVLYNDVVRFLRIKQRSWP